MNYIEKIVKNYINIIDLDARFESKLNGKEILLFKDSDLYINLRNTIETYKKNILRYEVNLFEKSLHIEIKMKENFEKSIYSNYNNLNFIILKKGE